MFAVAFLVLLTGAPATQIEVWTRAPGDYVKDGNLEHLASLALDVSSRKTTTLKQRDLHYREVVELRGLDLRALIREKRPKGTDRALLHFANGVRIPVVVTDREPALFLATSIYSDGEWSSAFPDAPRKLEFYADPRPTTFGANKVSVVASDDEAFTPWRHADTLVGIEYLVGAAYDRQFSVKGNEEGTRIFLDSCQYCHAVWGVGGHLGWDFVDPLPVSEYRETPRALYYHVSFRSEESKAKGLLMPVPRKLTMDEAKILWDWLRDVSKTDRPAYRP